MLATLRLPRPRKGSTQAKRGNCSVCPGSRQISPGRACHSQPSAAGCLVLEGVHCQDADARVAAGEWHAAARAKIQQYIARHRPQDALRVTDYMDTLMLGLSAKAREGDSLPRLLETVRLAGLALERILPA